VRAVLTWRRTGTPPAALDELHAVPAGPDGSLGGPPVSRRRRSRRRTARITWGQTWRAGLFGGALSGALAMTCSLVGQGLPQSAPGEPASTVLWSLAFLVAAAAVVGLPLGVVVAACAWGAARTGARRRAPGQVDVVVLLSATVLLTVGVAVGLAGWSRADPTDGLGLVVGGSLGGLVTVLLLLRVVRAHEQPVDGAGSG